MINRKLFFNYIYPRCVSENNCKVLDYQHTKGKYFFYIRDRKYDQRYFKVEIKGNYIRAYQMRYVCANGNGINTFIDITLNIFIGKEIETLQSLETILLCKIPIRNYKEFPKIFEQKTFSLDWY